MSHCAVPYCNTSRKEQKFKDVWLFITKRSDLARNEKEKEHREELTKFILKLRDCTKGDIIKKNVTQREVRRFMVQFIYKRISIQLLHETVLLYVKNTSIQLMYCKKVTGKYLNWVPNHFLISRGHAQRR